MNTAYLRRKGWSETEIRHARDIFRQAQERRPLLRTVERAFVVLAIAVTVVGALAAALQLLPLALLATPGIVVPLSFLMGTLLGLLLVHVLWTLRSGHHLAGAAAVALACIAVVTPVLAQARIGSPLLVSLPLAAGIIIPYIVHWWHHGTA